MQPAGSFTTNIQNWDDMPDLRTHLTEAGHDPAGIVAAVILGSGLGSFTEGLEILQTIAYRDISGFPDVTVKGHSGEMILGRSPGGQTVLAAKGRFHYYEGHDMEAILTLVRHFHLLGVTRLIVTNAAGLIDSSRKVGDIFFIERCIDLTGLAGQAGDPGSAECTAAERELAFRAARRTGLDLGSGVYAWTTGPSYETPAEIRHFSGLGANLVGMSTMPELIYAREHGMQVIGLSCATNFAAGITKNPLTHQEVFEAADKIKDTLSQYVQELVSQF